jgi:hypothetical protein
VTGDSADERQQIVGQPEDPRPAVQPDLVSLFVVSGKSKAACPLERISGDRFEPVECRFGSAPELLRRLGAVRLTCDVVPVRRAKPPLRPLAPFAIPRVS